MFDPSHLQVAIVFALLASIVMGVVGRSSDRARLRYGLYCFGYFMGAVFVLGWLMRIGHG